MEERAKRYRRVAVSGNSGETYRKIKVKTAATKLNQTHNATSMAKSAEEISTLRIARVVRLARFLKVARILRISIARKA